MLRKSNLILLCLLIQQFQELTAATSCLYILELSEGEA
jgi:hypothetical protein